MNWFLLLTDWAVCYTMKATKTYNIQRCVLPLSLSPLSFLSLLFGRFMLHADTHTSEPRRLSTEACAGSYCNGAPIITIMQEKGKKNLFLLVAGKKNRGAN